jgi:hypothetical protein
MPTRSITDRSLRLSHANKRPPQSYSATPAWERVAFDIVGRVRSEIRALKLEIAAIETLCETRKQPREPNRH